MSFGENNSLPTSATKNKTEVKKTWLYIGLIFISAFFARVIFFFLFRDQNPMWGPHGIGINGWLGIAQRLASGQGYTEESLLTYFKVSHLIPTAARSPLPILILSAVVKVFGSHYYYPLFIYSWALSSLTAVVLYFFASDLFGSQKIAMTASMIYSFYLPEMLISTGYAAASESLFTLLLMFYFMSLYRSLKTARVSWALGCGFLLGLACLTRPAILFFVFFYAISLWIKQRARFATLLTAFLAAFLLCMSPWVIRNQIVFHKPIVTTTLGGYNLLRHNGMIERGEYKITQPDEFDSIARTVIQRSGKSLESLSEVELDLIFKNEALRIIRAYPLRYLKLCVYRLGWIWYKINLDKPRYWILNGIIYSLMFPAWIFFLMRRHDMSVIASHFLGFVGIHALINVQFRFVSPMMPYGILMAVASIFFLIRLFNPRNV